MERPRDGYIRPGGGRGEKEDINKGKQGMKIDDSRSSAVSGEWLDGEWEVADVRDYESSLRRYFSRRVGRHPEVDDLVQESLTRYFLSCRKAIVAQPYGYIFRIAKNLLIDRSRSHYAGPLHITPTDDEQWPAVPPEQENQRRYEDLHSALTRALEELPEKCRHAFILKRFHDLDTPAIAEKLNISPRMVQKYLVRAMSHLHSRLKKAEELPE